MTAYQNNLQKIRTKAQHVCGLHGDDHDDCIEAWETVEALEQIEESIYEVMHESMEQYCLAYPDAQECRILTY
jgi:CP12 domain